MRILLVNPPQFTQYPQPPLGLAMLAAVLERNGHFVKIVDLAALGLSEKAIPQILQDERPKLVGITAMTSTVNSAINVAREIKRCDPSVLIILGGAHASILPEETLQNNPGIDMIVRGEGENTIIDVADSLENGEYNLSKVLGLTYRSESGLRNNPLRPPILDLDALPFPAFHLLPKGKYRLHPPFGRKTPAMPIMVSRGCPYSCIFCSKSVFGNKYRNNSPAYIVNQIKLLTDEFGVREIKFYDDVFTLNEKWVIDICAKLEEQGIEVPWTCETRVNLVNKELLMIMKTAGCYMIAFGVESGDQNVLNTLGKNVSLDQIAKAFKITNEVGMGTVGYFMLGSPNETPATIERTIKFAQQVNPDFVQFSIATPFPGTALYRLASEKRCLPEKWDEYVYADLKSLGNSTFHITSMSGQQLREWTKKAYTAFYLRRDYILKRMRKMTSFAELKTDAIGLQMLLDLVK